MLIVTCMTSTRDEARGHGDSSRPPRAGLLKVGFDLQGGHRPHRSLGVENVYVEYPDLAGPRQAHGRLPQPGPPGVSTRSPRHDHLVQKSASPTVSFTDYYAATRELIATLMRQGAECGLPRPHVGQARGRRSRTRPPSPASRLMIGLHIEPYLIQQRSRLEPRHARDVINLGVAGMLHDIGRRSFPRGAQVLPHRPRGRPRR